MENLSNGIKNHLKLSDILPSTILLAQEAKDARDRQIHLLIQQKKIPENGWDDLQIEYALKYFSLLDSNNFLSHTGVGEREGRIFSKIVQRRHYGLSHGIGRSGDIKSAQPKAVGSSLINILTNALSLHAIQLSGVKNTESCFVVPCSTGMALTLCLLYFRRLCSATHILWPRIDQKSCLKCMLTAGFIPEVIELRSTDNDDELKLHIDDLESRIYEIGIENIVCIMTTTSCFAPRTPDDIIKVAVMCKRLGVRHLVNNAYGLQCDKICNALEEASRIGRIDAFVQSTDKNFMVPVGGAVIAGFDRNVIDSIAQLYPGRASCSPSIDLLITMLSMGQTKYLELRKKRRVLFDNFKNKLQDLALKYGETVLNTPRNTISMAMSLRKLDSGRSEDITKLGSMLFTRQCSGARVVVKCQSRTIEGITFDGWMSHSADYKCSYLNVAAAIGQHAKEIDRFLAVLDECLEKLYSEIA